MDSRMIFPGASKNEVSFSSSSHLFFGGEYMYIYICMYIFYISMYMYMYCICVYIYIDPLLKCKGFADISTWRL